MRTFVDAKDMAKALRAEMSARHGVDLTHSEALELVAHQHGLADWNTLAAEIAKPVPPEPAWTPRVRRVLEASQQWSSEMRHTWVGVEHLMLAIVDDPDSVAAAALDEVGARESTKQALLRILASQGYYTAGVPILDDDGNLVFDEETGQLLHREIPPSKD